MFLSSETRATTENDRLFSPRSSAILRPGRFGTGLFRSRNRRQTMPGWTKNISAMGFLISAFLSVYLAFLSNQKDARIVILTKHIELSDKRISDLMKEAQHYKVQIETAAAEGVLTHSVPTQFGFYVEIGSSTLQPLELLTTEKRDLPLDFPKYTDMPTVFLKYGVPTHLILYHPKFSLIQPDKLAFHIAAKVKGEEAWVIQRRTLEAQVFPRDSNSDILDVYVAFKPGRYALEFDGKYYSFNVEGTSNEPDSCVQRRRGVFQNEWIPCRGRIRS